MAVVNRLERGALEHQRGPQTAMGEIDRKITDLTAEFDLVA
jgi:hypothetical protein